MQFLVIGLNYKTAKINLLERLAYPPGEAGQAAARLLQHPSLLEAVLLSTCHRVEVYAVTSDPVAGEGEILRFLGTERRVPAELLEQSSYRYSCQDAVEYLFKVASGLESLVLGESEILAQVKRAFHDAHSCGATGTLLNKLFMQAAEVGKRVRAETGISRGHTSLASVAVEAIAETFPDLGTARVLVVGAGQICESAARLLAHRQVRRLYIANRTVSRAQEMADRYSGVAIGLPALAMVLPEVDAIIVGTAAPHYLIRPGDLQPVLETRRRPLVCIDLSVPRNVDPEVASLSGVIAYDMNGFQEVIRHTLGDRARVVEKAESLVQLQMNEFLQWFNGLDTTPTIAALQEILEGIRQGEMNRLGGRWSRPLGKRDQETLESITRGIVQKILHGPAMRLKGMEDPEQRLRCLEALATLFGLEPISYPDHYYRQRRLARTGNERTPDASAFRDQANGQCFAAATLTCRRERIESWAVPSGVES